jgi:hypothetical protein
MMPGLRTIPDTKYTNYMTVLTCFMHIIPKQISPAAHCIECLILAGRMPMLHMAKTHPLSLR